MDSSSSCTVVLVAVRRGAAVGYDSINSRRYGDGGDT